MMIEPLNPLIYESQVRGALLEDLGRAGDITSAATIPAPARARVHIATRKPGRVAGLDVAALAFHLVAPQLVTQFLGHDGQSVREGHILMAIEGPARAILTAERVALNFLGHLSGVATATAALIQSVAGTKARIVCTRKTTPGLRALEKYAVRCGGGHNHRFGLDDAILIKDNHIGAAGGVSNAILAARRAAGHLVRIEIEVETLDQLDEALRLKADAIMLDNMDLSELREAVRRNQGQAMLEASGNVTLETAPAIAATGVDLISVGWITHSAPNLDVGLDFETLV